MEHIVDCYGSLLWDKTTCRRAQFRAQQLAHAPTNTTFQRFRGIRQKNASRDLLMRDSGFYNWVLAAQDCYCGGVN